MNCFVYCVQQSNINNDNALCDHYFTHISHTQSTNNLWRFYTCWCGNNTKTRSQYLRPNKKEKAQYGSSEVSVLGPKLHRCFSEVPLGEENMYFILRLQPLHHLPSISSSCVSTNMTVTLNKEIFHMKNRFTLSSTDTFPVCDYNTGYKKTSPCPKLTLCAPSAGKRLPWNLQALQKQKEAQFQYV